VVHSLERFLGKFDHPGKRMRTLSFLLFDHIAGIDTLFYTLSSGGALIVPETRDPRSICRLIENHRIEVLPTSPTFLNLLGLSNDYEDFDLSSLQIITYGSEPMSQPTLNRLSDIFPDVKIMQKYGTSEFGSPRTLSRGNDSLWLKPKPDELEIKIIDDILWVRSQTAMLGYLNVASPFDADGWYCTGDRVEQDGEWLHILGRQSEMIIIGGEKVYPQEVESVILELDIVQDVIVKGESHPLTGQIVTARVNLRLSEALEAKAAVKEIRKHCREHLEAYKVPIKIAISSEPLATDRQKKIRR
jgi:acyl-CoA synthetase (AMP-forming)/AMP-acid ligase II